MIDGPHRVQWLPGWKLAQTATAHVPVGIVRWTCAGQLLAQLRPVL